MTAVAAAVLAIELLAVPAMFGKPAGAVEAASAHAVYWRWVRGHAGHAQNEYANDLAVRAAGAQSSSGGLIESGFDAWLAERVAMNRPVNLEPFPDAAVFRASRTLPATHSTSP